MQLSKNILLTVSIVAIGLSGCVKSYDLTPTYNDSSKTVLIEGYPIRDVTYYHEGDSKTDDASMGRTAFVFTKIKSSGICSYLNIQRRDISGHLYYLSSAEDNILAQYNNKCNNEKIGNNLNFLECHSKYYITSSKIKDSGYSDKRIIQVNEICFKDMKQYFKSIVKSGNHVVKSKQKNSMDTYKGVFISTKTSECASNGDISITLNHGKVYGGITYKMNNRNFQSNILGTIIDKQFAGNAENIKFIGTIEGNEIKGKYYSEKCEGVFTATRTH